MEKKRGWIISSVIILMIVGAGGLFYFFAMEPKELQLLPRQRQVAEPGPVSGTMVNTGWSAKEDAAQAVQEAVGMASRGNGQQPPDFAVIFATSGSDLPTLLAEVRKLWGDKTKIYGGTSDSRAVMTNRGFVRVPVKVDAPMPGVRGLAIMTVTSKDIAFGAGAANFADSPSAREAAKAALLTAIKSAGKSPQEKPQAVLATIMRGVEDEALEGIGQVVGKDAVVLGGTAGGPKFGVWGSREVYTEGISLAVIYTRLPLGWVFEGGFDVQDTHGGIVSKVDGRAIVEIDHRPALDVYNEWLGGRIDKLFAEVGDPRKIRDLLTLHPLYRRYTSAEGQNFFLFSHPWPKDQTLKERSVMTSTNIKAGDKVYLSHGTWETLVNRIGNLPTGARVRGGISPGKKPILGIGYLCAGVMGTIPEDERARMAPLINYAHKDAPFIAAFTWGEQGHFPGIGNLHGNLLTSFLVIGAQD